MEDSDNFARARLVAETVDAAYDGLPNGYECDKELSTFNDSQTYGEMATADVAALANVPNASSLSFAELGSGLGKLAIAAAHFFRSSVGVENAPERAAVARRALEKLGAAGAPCAPCKLPAAWASRLTLPLLCALLQRRPTSRSCLETSARLP